MDYHEMIRRIRKLDFIRNEQTADAAVKAILGVLASRLNEDGAQNMTGKFAEFLIQNKPREHQARSGAVSVAENMAEIRAQFKLSIHQANVLFRNVLYFTKEASGEAALVGALTPRQ